LEAALLASVGCLPSNTADCGQRLDTAVPPAQTSEAFPALQTYTPKYLAEKILTSRHALEGERKQVTVLFADIKGSTELIEGLDPAEARRLPELALRVMMDAFLWKVSVCVHGCGAPLS
jgi:hypothetical protein